MGVGEILAMERAQVSKNRRLFLPLMGGLGLLAWIAALTSSINSDLSGLVDCIRWLIGIYVALIVGRTVLVGQENALSGAPALPYFGNALLISLLVILVFLPFLGTAAGMFHYAFGGTNAIWEGIHEPMSDEWWAALPWDTADRGLLAGSALVCVITVCGISYISARWGYCMPGVAVGREPYGFLEGWRDSTGVVFSLIFAAWTVILIVSVVLGTIGFLLTFVHEWLGLLAFSLIEGVLGVALPIVVAVTWQSHTGNSD